MDASVVADALFFAGALAALAIVVYGGWLCIPDWETMPDPMKRRRGPPIAPPRIPASPVGPPQLLAILIATLLSVPPEVFA